MLMPGVLGSDGNPRIAGGLSAGQSYRLDGAESQSERRNDSIFNGVSVGALQEFKVQAGHVLRRIRTHLQRGGQLRNEVGNQRTAWKRVPLQSQRIFQRARLHLHSHGTARSRANGTPASLVGGPIYIPKVFDGRNKAFFFFAYERSWSKSGQPDESGYCSASRSSETATCAKYVNSSGSDDSHLRSVRRQRKHHPGSDEAPAGSMQRQC